MQGILKNKMLTQAGIPLYKMPCFFFSFMFVIPGKYHGKARKNVFGKAIPEITPLDKGLPCAHPSHSCRLGAAGPLIC
jgi:hypothetical protein